MKYIETSLPGVYVIEIEPVTDNRGFFARTWCRNEFASRGLESHLAQCSVSFNHNRGTLRGMHYQAHPLEECKLVRCTMGAIYDVVLDLRIESPTYLKWISVELTADNRKMVYVPKGMAHGFQTLVDNSEVFYQITVPYKPDYARGVRWDDPAFSIQWPVPDPIMSERDRSYPDYKA